MSYKYWYIIRCLFSIFSIENTNATREMKILISKETKQTEENKKKPVHGIVLIVFVKLRRS